MLQNNPELKNKIDQLWNKFWSGGIGDPLTAIEQITYLLFMKRLDELDLKRQTDAEWTGEAYTSKFVGTWIPPKYRNQPEPEKFAIDRQSLRWSEFRHMNATDRLPHVTNKVSYPAESSHRTGECNRLAFCSAIGIDYNRVNQEPSGIGT